MIETLKTGESYNSILAWHPDRLSRNMKESGEILDLLDNDVIYDLKFESYSFNNDAAGKMTLSILFAMAKEFSDKLSDDTKRGISKKIRQGMYCGALKRGYVSSSKGFYRPDADSFDTYKELWSQYKQGKSQIQLTKHLKEKNIKVTSNTLSNFFSDPFYAGYYCYGEEIVDLKSVDKKFTPMVSFKDFLSVQKFNRTNPRGWHISNEFRPFNELVKCHDCGNFMTPGLSKGKGDRYLYITCGNKKCSESRVARNKKPIINTIRGGKVLDYVIELIEKGLNINEDTYQKALTKYLEAKNQLILQNNQTLKVYRDKKTKLSNKEQKLSDRLIIEKHPEVASRISDEMKVIIKDVTMLDKEIAKLDVQNRDYELDLITEFPKYEEFLNFFKDAVDTLKTTDNTYLMDLLVKFVIVNTTVEDKKIVAVELREPFKTYDTLRFISGVGGGRK